MSTEKTINWRCIRYGLCSRADDRTAVSLPAGKSFVCPGCGMEEGIQVTPPRPFPLKPVLIGFAFIVGAGLLLSIWSPQKPPPKPPAKLRGNTAAAAAQPTKIGALTDERTGLPKQVLARPQSVVFDEMPATSQASAAASEAKPAAGSHKVRDFQRFYVFKTSDTGWMQVGENPEVAGGWLSQNDSVDWPHSLVVEYTTPDNRRPVLFFREKTAASAILEEWPNHKTEVDAFYQRVEEIAAGGQPPAEDYPVLCVEPRDKIGDLYLLPVLSSELHQVDGSSLRLLNVTAAGRKRGATTLQNASYVSKALPQARPVLPDVPIDLVFVMDMTGSMQPWVDRVLKVMGGIAARIESSKRSAPVMMGFWGYQDNPGLKGIQFLTKNFTPSLVAPSQFASILSGLKVNKVTDDDYPEEVFAGVFDAISPKTAWRPGARKILILVGDAPGHESIAEGGTTETNVKLVRQQATDAGVQIAALQIKDFTHPSYEKHHQRTTDQFSTLATNGNRPPAHLTISSKEPSPFEAELQAMISELVEQHSVKGDRPSGAESKGKKIAEGLLAAAKVDQVAVIRNNAGEVEVPRDFTGWVVDRDLGNPEVVSLEPKLLVTKNELSTLQQTVTSIISKARKGMIVGGSFFDEVLNSVAQTASKQNMTTLAGAVPKFITGLPYKSDLMEKSSDWWNARTAVQQEEFIRGLEAKLGYYQKLNDEAGKWRALNNGDESGANVTAIPLSLLP